MAEPNPNISPLRTFIDGTPPPATSLGELRIIMKQQTVELVTILGQRCMNAVGAAVFKNDEGEVSAPSQQTRNISSAVEVAKELWPDWTAFHRFIEQVVTVVVEESVVMQLEAFQHTIPIENQP